MRFAAKGDISSAIGILRPLAEASDDPGDRLLLGRMAFLATDYTEAQAQLEHAYREFQVRGLPRRAAMAATTLGGLYFSGLEDQVVGRGWFARALRLLEYVYYAAPGHLPRGGACTELITFSPTVELEKVNAVPAKNRGRLGASR